MRIAKALIPFGFLLAAGCTAATPSATPTATTVTKPAEAVARVKLPTMTSSTARQVVLLIDGFEGDETAWTVCIDPECADSSAASVALTPDHAAHGIRALASTLRRAKNSRRFSTSNSRWI